MIRKRKNSKNQPCYQVIIRDNDGHPAQYETFPTMQEAKDWEIRERARRRTETYFPEKIEQKHTLADLIMSYTNLLKHLGKKSTRDILRHLKWWNDEIGDIPLLQIKGEVLAKCRTKLLEEGDRSPSTVNRYIASISAVFTHGVKECGWLESNPMLRISKLKEPPGRDRLLSPEEYERLIKASEASKNRYLKTIILIAVTTGMRQGEILSLHWEDIDFDREHIHIRTSKNGKSRRVPLDFEVAIHLRTLSLTRSTHTAYIFASSTRFGKISIRKAFEEALKRANIHHFHFHDIRHAYSTYSNMDGGSGITLMTSLGHSSMQMTTRYTHAGVNEMRTLTKSVGKYLMRRNDE
ncbi:MAG: tyrosine-type recombinase/integrase [Chlamydiia bacterium]